MGGIAFDKQLRVQARSTAMVFRADVLVHVFVLLAFCMSACGANAFPNGSGAGGRNDGSAASGNVNAGGSGADAGRAQGGTATSGAGTAGTSQAGSSQVGPRAVSPITPGKPADVGTLSGSWKLAGNHIVTRWAKDVNAAAPLPDYPRPQLVRNEWASLNGLWDYAITPMSDPQPSTWAGKLLVPFPVESALSGVMQKLDEVHKLWYQRSFRVPDSWGTKRVILNFGAVDWETHVWINGSQVGVHKGGYDPFSFDITQHLKRNSVEQIVVSVYDPSDKGLQPRGKQALSPAGVNHSAVSGIWQSVWLEPVADASIASLTLQPDMSNSSVKVRANVRASSNDLTLTAVVTSDGYEIGRVSGAAGAQLSVPIHSPQLWSPSTPFLYDLVVELHAKGTLVDRVGSYFGMRTQAVAKDAKGDTRLTLNNEFVFQLGLLDQGYFPDGLYTAPTDEAIRWEIQAQKELGFNVIRKHAKVEPARWYYWCDRLGMLVWQDMPSTGLNKDDTSPAGQIARAQFKTELKSMLTSFGNHPSIIQWTIFSEGLGHFDVPDNVAFVKSLDALRPIDAMSGYDAVGGDTNVGDVIDRHDHNYPRPTAAAPQTLRASALGEFGGIGLAVPSHTWNDAQCCQGSVGNAAQLTDRIELLFAAIEAQVRKPGLSAAVYTQFTDVEDQKNGFYTYDRAVLKPTLERIKRAAARVIAHADYKTLLAASDAAGASNWRYTFTAPPPDWNKPAFNASSWSEGKPAFGTTGPPTGAVGTLWNSNDIWMRKTFTVTAPLPTRPLLHVFHDESAQVFLNGVQVRDFPGYFFNYLDVEFSPEAANALKVGDNVLAVHCQQTNGAQFIDVGLKVAP
jgi:hypothetical protein